MYIERFLWIPLEVNAGLGDLNNYVGNVALEPEVSDQLELSLDFELERGYVAPRIYYRAIDDYIQGMPSLDPAVIAVSGNANGDASPLQFTNVDAELYGFDIVARYELTDGWRVDATLDFVRGRRRDVDDYLYRVAPLSARIAFTRTSQRWSMTLESVLVDEQDRISKSIVLDEPRSINAPTPGYGLVNVYGRWNATAKLQIRFGIENVFDRHYTNHLAGFNRVAGSSVPFGSRVPGTGLNAFAQLQVGW